MLNEKTKSFIQIVSLPQFMSGQQIFHITVTT